MAKRASLTHDSKSMELELPLLAPQERSQRSRSGTSEYATTSPSPHWAIKPVNLVKTS